MTTQQVNKQQPDLIQRASEFLMRGRKEAFGIAFLSAFVPYITWVASVIMCFVTLRKGAKEGLLVIFIAIVIPSSVLSIWYATPPQTLLQSLLLMGVLPWLFAVVLRSTVSWVIVLNVATCVGILGVLLFHAYIGDTQQYWIAHFQTAFSNREAIARLGVDEESLFSLLQSIAPFFTGIQVTISLFNTLVNLMVARWLQAKLYKPGGLAKELRNIRLRWLLAIFLLLCFILAAIDFEISYDLLPVILFTYLIGGLSLVHYLVQRIKFVWVALIGFYGLLILLFPYMVALLVLAVLADSGFNLRKRVGRVGYNT